MLHAMQALLVFYISSFLHLLSPIAAKDTPSYFPTDYFLIDCGSSTNTTSMDGRYWQSDVLSKFLPSNSKTVSSASFASVQDPSVPQIPFMTARISHYKFTYSFPVSPGPKFVRLYFYPAAYLGLDISQSFFSTTSGSFTLLSNFSAFFSAMEPPQTYLIKEFLITVRDGEELNLTFSPSEGSYAFVNGIEVVSMPYNLYQSGDDNPVPYLDQTYLFYIDNNTALEKMYRFNVGSNNIPIDQDNGMFRSWQNDDQYIYGAAFGTTSYGNITIRYTPKTPAYTAPTMVYSTSRTMGPNSEINLNYNLTWIFSVDSGFYYLFRLHFCEYSSQVTKINQRVFQIFINNQTAESAADVIAWNDGTGIPSFKDYIVFVTVPDGSPDKQDIWLALHPDINSHPQYYDAILNGLEIFKLNQSNGNLAGPNPIPVSLHAPSPSASHGPKSKGSLPLIKVIVGTMISGIVAVFLSCFCFFFGWKRILLSRRQSAKSTQRKSSFLPTELCRRFEFSEIEAATNNFDDCLVIGDGGFGKVYKGYIDGRHVPVAVKRLKAKSQQGAREFWTEIEMLSQLRYIHLVSLIGYCNDEREMILVYDYMANGTLRDHLYGNNNNSPLPWKQRLVICIGGARGLAYLHTGAVHRIIHRDVKTTNILLDEKWVAKVSDFGLSKLSPIITSTDPISTEVKGTFGYMDPEYFRRKQVTEKTDVYSFGVVLLEVLCARPAVNLKLEEEKMSLANWASACIREGELDEIMDPYLRGKIAPKCLRLFVEIAESCLHDRGIQRPTMADVVASLECALQLQESADNEEDVEAGDGLWFLEEDSYQELPIL